MLPLKDSQPAGIFPFWTIAIIALNIYVFYLQLTSTNMEGMIYQYGLVPVNVDYANYYSLIPFITSQFLHGGFLHIASNMLFLWVFGDNVEAHFGKLFYPAIYLLSGAVGGLSQYLLSPASEIPMIGASGAVAGVLGAYFALYPHHKVKTLVLLLGFVTVVELPAFAMLLYWIVTQFFSGVGSVVTDSLDVGGVAYFAHIGGFVTGWILAQATKGRGATTPEYVS